MMRIKHTNLLNIKKSNLNFLELVGALWIAFNFGLIFHLLHQGFQLDVKPVAEFHKPALRRLETRRLAELNSVSPDLFLRLEFLVHDFLIDASLHLGICGPASSLLPLTSILSPSEQVSPWNSIQFRNNFDIFSRNNLQ